MAEEPAYLSVGTEVSAKYRGAFCEAKVKKVVRNVKCKVTLKETGASLVAPHEDINGHLKAGLLVEVKHPETSQYMLCVINKITDQSSYTVVFDDGDENTLRRTQLCLKGEKHFVKSDTLDELPLTHPEHFGTPVMRGARKLKAKRYMHNPSSDSDSDIESSDEEISQVRTTRGGKREPVNCIGHVVCVEIEDRKKTMWVPALVVQPTADGTELKTPDHILVKSFRDSKFFPVLQRDVKEFSRDMATKNEDKVLKVAFEKALQYYDTHELPQMWDKGELLGSDSEDDDDTSDEEPSEERDRFVAQLYKFMDDRGTPMNKSPQIAGRDLNLYKMFRVVQDMGGYNKVTNQVKWHVVYNKMGLPPVAAASNHMRMAYKKFLHAFEDFDRKLGCTMGTITRPRVRHYPGRNLVSFRERESTPKSPRSLKAYRDNEEGEETSSGKDNSDRSDVDSSKGEPPFKHRLLGNSSDSETDSVNSRTVTRDKPMTRDDLSKAKEDLGRPVREEVKRAREEAMALRVVREEERKTKVEKDAPVRDDKEEGRQPKKRGRKKDAEDLKEEKRLFSKRLAKDDTASEVSEERTEHSDEDDDDKDHISRGAFPIGSKIRIKYGKGKNNKVYEAKVIEEKCENGNYSYKVHYAGWNVRYDEWIRKDRIVGLVSECGNKNKCKTPTKPPSSLTAFKSISSKPSTTTPLAKKIGRKQPAPQTPTPAATKDKDTPATVAKSIQKTPGPAIATKTIAVASAKSQTPATTTKSPVAQAKTPSPAPKMLAPTTGSKTPATTAAPKAGALPMQSKSPVTTGPAKTTSQQAGSKVPRPTRSTSVESMLSGGLPSKIRPNKGGGIGDSESLSKDSDSDTCEESSEEDIPERVTRSRAEADSRNVKSTPDVVADPKASTVTVSAGKPEPEKQVVLPMEIKEEETPKEGPKKQKQPNGSKPVDTKEDVAEVKSETTEEAQSVSEPKTEVKTDKKVDDKIYDFEDSSSQDSFRDDVPLARQIVMAEVKDATEKARFTRKDPIQRVRRKSNDSNVSTDSAQKAPVLKVESKALDLDLSRTTKETLRSGKKVTETKPEPVKVQEPEKEKKKPGPKPKDGTKGTTAEKIKAKPTPKPEKGRGKRKVDNADGVSKVEDVEVKKPRKKKDLKDEKASESSSKDNSCKKTPSKKPSESQPGNPMDVISCQDDTHTPEKKVEEMEPEASWSPNYIPAPTLTQTVSIDTKPELEVIDEPAPQLSPIIGANINCTVMPSVSMEPTQLDTILQPVIPITECKDSVTEPSVLFDNTPPETPEGSVSGGQSGGGTPLQHEDSTGVHSEPEVTSTDHSQEPSVSTTGGESPNTCDTSTVSNGSGGSSGNAPGSESEDLATILKTPKEEEIEKEEEKSVPKRRKRRQQSAKSAEKAGKKLFKQSMSDSDEQDQSMRSPEPTHNLSLKSMASGQATPPQRVSKYNFLDLQEGKYLEGEARIKFLMGKITDIRKLYMQLKSEVACIDRRRKRQRRKMHDAQAAAAAAAAVAAVVSRGEAEKS